MSWIIRKLGTVDRPLLVGLGVLALLALGMYLGIERRLPFQGPGGRVVRAEFERATQLRADTPVRVRGVDVGLVEKVERDGDGERATVVMRIQDDDVRIARDARAEIRWRTVLGGNMAVELDPGSPSAPELGDAVIPRARTRTQVELDQLLQVYDGRTIASQRQLIAGLAGALEGGAAAEAIERLGPRLADTGPALRALRGERDGDLRALVHSAARTTAAFDRSERALRELVTGGGRTFSAIARQRERLGSALALAPDAMAATVAGARSIDRALPSLDAVAEELRPGARALAPAVEDARPALVRLDRLLDRAEPLLAEARPAVRRLSRAAPTGRRVVAAASPVVERLDRELLPWLDTPDDDSKLPVYQMIGPTFATLSAGAAYYDGAGHVLNFPLFVGENPAAFIPCTTFLLNPTQQEKARCASLEQIVNHIFGSGVTQR